MKILFIFFTLFLFKYDLMSQSIDSYSLIDTSGITSEQALYRTAFILVDKVSHGKRSFGSGAGFIINGEYLATCYHVYPGKKDQFDTVYKVKVLYNIRPNREGGYDYEETSATLSYEPTSEQYNFQKHTYDEKDPRTDFVVLKLAKKVSQIAPIFLKVLPVQDSWFRVSGIIQSLSNTGPTVVSSKHHLVYNHQTGGCTEMFHLGPMKKGFSGSPCFDSTGHIIGIVQRKSDWDASVKELDTLFKQNLIPDEKYLRFQNLFPKIKTENFGMGKSLHTEYFLKTYLKGYL